MTAPAKAELLLAEELLLLVLDDERGHNTAQGADSGLAGALLLDLAAGGWIDAAEGKLVPAAAPPPGPPAGVLAEALAAIRGEDKPRDARHWVRKLPTELRPIKGRVATRLVEQGVLSEQRRKVLGLVPVERYAQPIRSPSAPCDGVTPEEVFDYWRGSYEMWWGEQPFTVIPDYAARVIERKYSPTGPSANAFCHSSAPGEYATLARLEVGIVSVIAELRATNHWDTIAAEFFEAAPPFTTMGKAEQAFFEQRTVVAEGA